jgi:4-coumarate--CoA ligase
LLENAKEACKKAGIEEDRIILMGDERDESYRFKQFTALKNIDRMRRFRKAKIDPEKDLAFLVYSSGTTGHPKVCSGIRIEYSH